MSTNAQRPSRRVLLYVSALHHNIPHIYSLAFVLGAFVPIGRPCTKRGASSSVPRAVPPFLMIRMSTGLALECSAPLGGPMVIVVWMTEDRGRWYRLFWLWNRCSDRTLSCRCPCLCTFSGTCQFLAAFNVLHRVRISVFSRVYSVPARIYLYPAAVSSFILSSIQPPYALSSYVPLAISPLFSPHLLYTVSSPSSHVPLRVCTKLHTATCPSIALAVSSSAA